MGTARTDPAVTVLADGRVLVAGGMYDTGLKDFEASADAAVLAGGIRLADMWPGPEGHALATAELFDPETGAWSSTGPMRYARGTPSAVTLADGRVLLAGAGQGGRVDDQARPATEVYDPVTGRFDLAGDLPSTVDQSLFDQLGVPTSDRCDQADVLDVGTLVALDDGEHPSSHGRHRDLERDGPHRGRLWERRGWRMGPARLGSGRPGRHHRPHAPRADPRGGGVGEDDLGIRAAELFDSTTGAWSALPDMPGARATAAGVALFDGSVLIVGGWSNGGDGWPMELGDAIRFIPGS